MPPSDIGSDHARHFALTPATTASPNVFMSHADSSFGYVADPIWHDGPARLGWSSTVAACFYQLRRCVRWQLMRPSHIHDGKR